MVGSEVVLDVFIILNLQTINHFGEECVVIYPAFTINGVRNYCKLLNIIPIEL